MRVDEVGLCAGVDPHGRLKTYFENRPHTLQGKRSVDRDLCFLSLALVLNPVHFVFYTNASRPILHVCFHSVLAVLDCSTPKLRDQCRSSLGWSSGCLSTATQSVTTSREFVFVENMYIVELHCVSAFISYFCFPNHGQNHVIRHLILFKAPRKH